MRMRHVIPAIEIIVYIHLPVTLQGIDAAVEIMQLLGDLQGRYQGRDFPEEFRERRRVPIEIDENEILPGTNTHRHQSIVFALEIAHAFEFHYALQRAVITIGPTVIRTAELFRATRLHRNHSGRVVHVDRKELPRLSDLIEPADRLPVARKNAVT